MFGFDGFVCGFRFWVIFRAVFRVYRPQRRSHTGKSLDMFDATKTKLGQTIICEVNIDF